MGLGAIIKVKMDTSAVKRGLASIGGMFRRLGGVLRGIGGMMRKSLVPIVGILAGFGFAAKKVADLGSELSDMAVQTGVSVSKLVELKEMLRLAGVPMRDTSRMLSLMASNIQEARFKPGAARESLEMLGLRSADFIGMDIERQFMLIMERIRDTGKEMAQLDLAMEGIFGGRMGGGLQRLGKDLDANVIRARKNVESFAAFMQEHNLTLDKTADSIGRLGMIFQEVIGRIMIKLPLDKFADALNSIDVGKISGALAGFMVNPAESIMKAWNWIGEQITILWEKLMAMMANILDGFVEKLKGIMPKLPTGKGIKEWLMRDPGEPGHIFREGETGRMLNVLERSEQHLADIKRKEGATFA